jgi:hypothetical protein
MVIADEYVHPQRFLTTLPSGNFPCHNCVNCNAIIKGDFFLHLHTGKKMYIRGRISCKTKCVVFVLKCPCGYYYVGKPKRECKVCITEHKSNIRNGDEKSPVARRFNAAGHDVCQQIPGLRK